MSLVVFFYNREKEYENWVKENENGFIFNRAGGKTGNVLHSVGCYYLESLRFKGTYTTRYPKYCSIDIKELINIAEGVSRPMVGGDVGIVLRNNYSLISF